MVHSESDFLLLSGDLDALLRINLYNLDILEFISFSGRSTEIHFGHVPLLSPNFFISMQF